MNLCINMKSIYKVLSKDDIYKATEVLAKAFYDYPIIQFLLPNDREKKISHFFNVVVKIGVRYGEVFGTSKDFEGVAIWLDSNKHIGLLREIRCGGLSILYNLGFKSFKKCLAFDTFISNLHKEHRNTQHYHYLEFIGVDPIYQGKGFGSKLLRNKFKDLKKKGLPIYLDTHSQDNISIYQHLGFKIIDEVVVPDANIPQWSMFWNPHKNSE